MKAKELIQAELNKITSEQNRLRDDIANKQKHLEALDKEARDLELAIAKL